MKSYIASLNCYKAVVVMSVILSSTFLIVTDNNILFSEPIKEPQSDYTSHSFMEATAQR